MMIDHGEFGIQEFQDAPWYDYGTIIRWNEHPFGLLLTSVPGLDPSP